MGILTSQGGFHQLHHAPHCRPRFRGSGFCFGSPRLGCHTSGTTMASGSPDRRSGRRGHTHRRLREGLLSSSCVGRDAEPRAFVDSPAVPVPVLMRWLKAQRARTRPFTQDAAGCTPYPGIMCPARLRQWSRVFLKKGSTARSANRLLLPTGQPFWQDESWDRYLRDSSQLNRGFKPAMDTKARWIVGSGEYRYH